MSRESKNYCRVEVIADLFGVSVRRVQQLTQDGTIKSINTPNGKRYDMNSTVKAYIKFLSDKAYGRGEKVQEGALKIEKMEADIELKKTQNELHQLRVDIMDGKYIKIEQAKADYSKFMVVLKRLLVSIPSRVAGCLNGQVDPSVIRVIESDIDSDIKNTLQSFIVAGVTDERS